MNHRFKKAIIDDVTAANVDDKLQTNLLELFGYAMKSVAPTLVREARFDTTDFATSHQRGCEGFAMIIRRTTTDSKEFWFGAIQRGERRIDVIGHLE